MNNLVEAIDKEVSTLPPALQQEVYDFVGYLQSKRMKMGDAAWLEKAWGVSPEFPDRPSQLPVKTVAGI